MDLIFQGCPRVRQGWLEDLQWPLPFVTLCIRHPWAEGRKSEGWWRRVRGKKTGKAALGGVSVKGWEELNQRCLFNESDRACVGVYPLSRSRGSHFFFFFFPRFLRVFRLGGGYPCLSIVQMFEDWDSDKLLKNTWDEWRANNEDEPVFLHLQLQFLIHFNSPCLDSRHMPRPLLCFAFIWEHESMRVRKVHC